MVYPFFTIFGEIFFIVGAGHPRSREFFLLWKSVDMVDEPLRRDDPSPTAQVGFYPFKISKSAVRSSCVLFSAGKSAAAYAETGFRTVHGE